MQWEEYDSHTQKIIISNFSAGTINLKAMSDYIKVQKPFEYEVLSISSIPPFLLVKPNAVINIDVAGSPLSLKRSKTTVLHTSIYIDFMNTAGTRACGWRWNWFLQRSTHGTFST